MSFTQFFRRRAKTFDYESPKQYRQAHPLAPRDTEGRPLDCAPQATELIGSKHIDTLGPVRKSASKDAYERLVSETSWDHLAVLQDSRILKSLTSQGTVNTFSLGQPHFDDRYGANVRLLTSPALPTTLQAEYCSLETLLRVAELWLDINRSLLTDSLCLIDGHRSNVAFDTKMRPVWIDHGSIIRSSNARVAVQEFLECQLWPISLEVRTPEMRPLLRHAQITANAYKAMHPLAFRTDIAVLYGWIYKALNRAVQVYRLFIRARNRIVSRQEIASAPPHNEIMRILVLGWIRIRLRGIRRNTAPSGFWSNYRDQEEEALCRASTVREHHLVREAKALSWHSCLDVGANDGRHTLLLAQSASTPRHFTAADYDDFSMGKFVRAVAQQPGSHRFTGLVADFFYNFGKHDLVLALAITHHLVLQQGNSFEAVASHLSTLTRHYCIVEFMPYGLTTQQHILSEKNRQVPDWYTEENFARALQRHFGEVQELYVTHYDASDLRHRVAFLARH